MAALLPLPAAVAAPPPARTAVFRVVGPGPGAVDVYLTAGTDDGILVVVRLGPGPHRAVRWSYVRELGGRTVPRAYGPPAHADPCAAPACSFAQREAELVHFGMTDTLAPGETIEIGVIADDADVRARGRWRTARLDSRRLSRLTGSDVGAVGLGTGAATGDFDYEVFRGTATTTAGGPGSFAFAALPCDIDGTGGGRLVGGSSPRDLRCDRPGARSVVAFARTATRWSLTADARGRYRVRSRLVVLVT